MNLNDILIPLEPNEPSFEYPPSNTYFPPKKIVICQDKILRYIKDDKQYSHEHPNSQIEQDNEKQDEELNLYQIQTNEKSEDDNVPNKNHKNQKRSYKTNQISKISIEERKRVKKRMANFDRKDSQAWKFLSLIYGPQIKQDKLISIAEYVASCLKIYIDRDARRRKSVLIKWFDENWNRIAPFFKIYV